MFEKIRLWLEKYTESKAASVPKYLSGKDKDKESGADYQLDAIHLQSEIKNIRRTKNMNHEDLLK